MSPTENTSEKNQELYPDVAAPPLMVHVVAPATLPAGYTFEALVNEDPDKTFTVEVPSTGVNEGDSFLAPLPESFDARRLRAPTGRWKDGLFDFCSLGVLHPHLWCAMCCPQVLMAQVMTRMNLTWLGEPGPVLSTKTTFKVVVAIVVSYIVFSQALAYAALPYDPEYVPSYIAILRGIGATLFSVWSLYSLCKTRENVRAMYTIKEEQCVGCEDLCCSFWCSCCTVAQLARHTGDYETYQGACCTESGLPDGSPHVV
mmetsp:Transcript_7920/g.11426  ORF Transcript_7920/g.11426 Transcript_7920/m.11426 type:complete len:258 (+) Transcript_7920:155-928(+)